MFTSYFISVIISLGVVLLLAWIVLRLIAPRVGFTEKTGHNMRIIETMPIAPRRNLHIVEVGKKFILLGSSEGGINFLTELDPSTIEIREERKIKKFKFLDILRGK